MKTPATPQKLRGGYYTPPFLADFLADWAIRSAQDHVLEPSCGDGALLEPVFKTLLRLGASTATAATQVTGVELESEEATAARARLSRLGVQESASVVHEADFFSYCRLAGSRRTFDAIVGNPPFIRYQHFAADQREIAFDLVRQLGLRPNGLTNAWVPFVAASTLLLKEGGRLAMVIPAELLQVDYTAQLRQFLSDRFRTVTVFTFRQLLFEGVQQEVVLLCADDFTLEPAESRISMVELDGPDCLSDYVHAAPNQLTLKAMDHSTEKWTQYYLDQAELDLIRELRSDSRLQRLGELASVDVGIVTGLNDFFVTTEGKRKLGRLNGYTRRLASRSAQLSGIVFSDENWVAHCKADAPVHLLDFPPVPFDELPDALQELVLSGEANEYHTGYKCRIRKLWYVVPSMWVPDAFMLRQIHRYPKIIVNRAGATCTDTIHRVKFADGVDGSRVAAAALNSLTFAFSEIVGRSYGGGVLELEPREAEKLPIPYGGADTLDLDHLHSMMIADNVSGVLDLTDRVLLRDWLGLSRADVVRIRGIWQRLQLRRVERKSKPMKSVREKAELAGAV